MRVAVIFNPSAGRGRSKERDLPRVIAKLSAVGARVESFPTVRTGHAVELARRASEDGFERVVAWGGDGTLNEVAGGLLGTDTPMGVLPGGTVNVFAREAHIPLSLEAALEAMSHGIVKRIPVGLANDRCFLAMAGIGIDAEVVYRMKVAVKSALGVLAFWLAGFRLLASYPMSPLRVWADGQERRGTGVIAGKLARFGPRYFITPDARMDEARFHVVVFQGDKRRDYLRYLLGVLQRRHLSFEDIEHFKTDRLTVEADTPVRCQLDGEPAGETPVRLEVRDRALAVILPRVAIVGTSRAGIE